MRHYMPHGVPIILTLSVCKGKKGAVVHLSLLFMALLHFFLFGGAFIISLLHIHVMEFQLQDNLTNIIVKIGLDLSYP